MEQSPSSEANRLSASQEIRRMVWTRSFITAYVTAQQLSLSWAGSIQSVTHIPLPEDPT